MGVYTYNLLTKSRKISVEGVKVEMHLLKFAGKESFWDKTPPHEQARLQRLENAWDDREYPEYVVKGDFEDGASVYTNWPTDGRPGGRPRLVVTDAAVTGTFAGYLRAKGSRFRLERWNNMSKQCANYDEAHALSRQLYGLLGDKNVLVTTTKENYKHEIDVTVFYVNPKDAVVLKLALA